MEQLKKILLKDIELQEVVKALFNKIIKRMVWLMVPVAMVFATLMAILIYMVNRPASPTQVQLDIIKTVSEINSKQQRFNQWDKEENARIRKDLIAARDSTFLLLRLLDSINKNKNKNK